MDKIAFGNNKYSLATDYTDLHRFYFAYGKIVKKIAKPIWAGNQLYLIRVICGKKNAAICG